MDAFEEFKLETRMTYRGIEVPKGRHTNDWDDIQFREGFAAALDLVLPQADHPEPAEALYWEGDLNPSGNRIAYYRIRAEDVGKDVQPDNPELFRVDAFYLKGDETGYYFEPHYLHHSYVDENYIRVTRDEVPEEFRL